MTAKMYLVCDSCGVEKSPESDDAGGSRIFGAGSVRDRYGRDQPDAPRRWHRTKDRRDIGPLCWNRGVR